MRSAISRSKLGDGANDALQFRGMDDTALVDVWNATAQALPSGRDLCGVVYHGPDTGWVAFACDAEGQTVGPEGTGIDAIAALRDLVSAMSQDTSPGDVPNPEPQHISPIETLEARIGRQWNWVEPLVGRVCSRITTDLYAPPIVLWFMYDGPTARIEINARFRLQVGQEEWHLNPSTDPAELGPLLSLIERRVTEAVAGEDGSLHMKFSDTAAVYVPASESAIEPWDYDVENEDSSDEPGDIPGR